MSSDSTTEGTNTSAPSARFKKVRCQDKYVLKAAYRKLDLFEIIAAGDNAALQFLQRARWPDLAEGEQRCPHCRTAAPH